jgi:hypothetical protein
VCLQLTFKNSILMILVKKRRQNRAQIELCSKKTTNGSTTTHA